MYATVALIHLQSEKVDEGLSTWRESFLPLLEQQKGYKGALAQAQPEERRGMSVLLWDTEEDAPAAIHSSSVQEQVGELHPFFAAEPVREASQAALVTISGR